MRPLPSSTLLSALVLCSWGLSPKPALYAQLTIGPGATVTVADQNAGFRDEGNATVIAGGGTLVMGVSTGLIVETLLVEPGARVESQGIIQARQAVDFAGTYATELRGLSVFGGGFGAIGTAGNGATLGLDGDIEVTLAPGFLPPSGTDFRLFGTSGTRVGTFAGATLPGPEWSVVYGPNGADVRYEVAPVPVSWLSFDGRPAGPADVALDWRTATERDSDYFGVERLGQGGGDDWREIGIVEAAGTTAAEQAYDYLDAGVGEGTHYYRLRQVDTDGTVDYSETVAVALGEGTGLSVYPSPALPGATLAVGASGFGESPLTLRLTGTDGRVLLERRYDAGPGTQSLPLPRDLPAGTYQVSLSSDSDAPVSARLVVIGRP